MKREHGALLLLLALMLLAAWNVRHADFMTDQIGETLLRSEHAAQRGEYEIALANVKSALRVWRDSRGYAGVFLRHSDVNDVTDAFYELISLLHQEEAAALPSGYARLRYHLRTLDRMEHVSAETVF